MADGINPPSVEYPVRVYFWTGDPSALLTAGFNSLRVERRALVIVPTALPVTGDWKVLATLPLVATRFNYNHLDPTGKREHEYRAVLQNTVTPGTPADIAQPIVRGVNVDFEMVMSVQELKQIYLWGEDQGFITDEAETQPDYTFVHNILFAIAKVERMLDIKLLPQRVVETHAWIPESMNRGYLSLGLNEFPTRNVESLTFRLSSSENVAFPAEWLRLDKVANKLVVVPDETAQMVRGPGPLTGYIPQALEVTYWAGFGPDTLTHDLKELVGKEAAIGPLNVGGDLIGGAGLAGASLSLDGASQSVTTTNSSTNAGFGARLIQYAKENKELYKALRAYYRGLRLSVA